MRPVDAISSAQLRELETDIRSELARIERSLARDCEEHAVLAAAGDGPLSESAAAASVANADDSLAITLNARVHARRIELTEALRRMHDGRYGVCDHCGGSIAYGRLIAVPEATNCLNCR